MNVDLLTVPAPDRALIGDSATDFLRRLDPTAIVYQRGRKRGPRRAVVTLLHGNEPSGVRALWDWFASEELPFADTIFILGNVAAALAAPGFALRHFDHERDMNRCFFEPFDDRQGLRCRQILDALDAFRPQCLIDIHNTSGTGPAFAVTTDHTPQHEALVTNFCEKMIITDIRLGSLMEAGEAICPTVTIECGGAIDTYADGVAVQGLKAYLRSPDPLVVTATDIPMETLHYPVRVELKPPFGIAYGDGPGGSGVVLRDDVERFNFGTTGVNEQLGWLGPEGLQALTAQTSNGREVLTDLFTIGTDNELLTARSLKLFMVTSHPAAAVGDCLFYAVRADNEPW